ncbi:MAG: crossover junction endodeoxyribonuclease RuvC [Longimicrobiaceae bacterium]
MLVLGVDPGTAVTGYGVVRHQQDGAVSLVECGVVRTSPRSPLADRLREIHQGVAEVIERHHPDRVAVEDLFYGKNVRTAMTLGHTRGVVLLAAALRGLPVSEYPPAQIKNAVVGRGRATKPQIGFMVQRLLGLSEPPRPEDAADGVAVALCDCFQSLGPAARLRLVAGAGRGR